MGERLWQVEMGEYTTMAAALPAVNMGEGPLVDCPLEVEGKRWQVTCIGVGNPHCVTVVAGGRQPEAGRDRPCL